MPRLTDSAAFLLASPSVPNGAPPMLSTRGLAPWCVVNEVAGCSPVLITMTRHGIMFGQPPPRGFPRFFGIW